jgi:hypothetical protein
MIIGHDGAGSLDEFGPDSLWAYINDNPEDDAWFEELVKQDELDFEDPQN